MNRQITKSSLSLSFVKCTKKQIQELTRQFQMFCYVSVDGFGNGYLTSLYTVSLYPLDIYVVVIILLLLYQCGEADWGEEGKFVTPFIQGGVDF